MAGIFLLAAVPAAITIWLPRKWLLVWLPVFWGSLHLLWAGIDMTDDPAFLSAAIVFFPIYLLNVPTTGVRLFFILADRYSESSRGYGD